VVHALQASPEIVAELLVKNVAMSTAMAITHRRNQNEEMAQGSDRVQRRTAHLIQLVQLPQVIQKTTALRQSAATGTGAYQAFLDRWNYDSEQRQAIQQSLEQLPI
jgi:D-tyrosyl-tRNA(Tyr) deacylase